jgi:hypothetical protein
MSNSVKGLKDVREKTSVSISTINFYYQNIHFLIMQSLYKHILCYYLVIAWYYKGGYIMKKKNALLPSSVHLAKLSPIALRK